MDAKELMTEFMRCDGVAHTRRSACAYVAHTDVVGRNSGCMKAYDVT